MVLKVVPTTKWWQLLSMQSWSQFQKVQCFYFSQEYSIVVVQRAYWLGYRISLWDAVPAQESVLSLVDASRTTGSVAGTSSKALGHQKALRQFVWQSYSCIAPANMHVIYGCQTVQFGESWQWAPILPIQNCCRLWYRNFYDKILLCARLLVKQLLKDLKTQ